VNMNLKNLQTYFGVVLRLYPLLVIFYLFYLVVIDFAYAHVDLIVIKIDSNLANQDLLRDKVDYRLNQIFIYFTVSATLLILSKLPIIFFDKAFFTKRLTNVGVNFKDVLSFYSSFYLIFGLVLTLMLASIYESTYFKFVIPFHYTMLALIPVYLIYQSDKKVKSSI
jgi:hypothetical protein